MKRIDLCALAAAIALLTLPGCAHESGADPCQIMIAHLESCGQSPTDGGAPPPTNCTDPQSSCTANCVTDASCKEIADPYAQKSKPFIDCLNSCKTQ